jgi:hypothetical protein
LLGDCWQDCQGVAYHRTLQHPVHCEGIALQLILS